jgi:hypothetical protein
MAIRFLNTGTSRDMIETDSGGCGCLATETGNVAVESQGFERCLFFDAADALEISPDPLNGD